MTPSRRVAPRILLEGSPRSTQQTLQSIEGISSAQVDRRRCFHLQRHTLRQIRDGHDSLDVFGTRGGDAERRVHLLQRRLQPGRRRLRRAWLCPCGSFTGRMTGDGGGCSSRFASAINSAGGFVSSGVNSSPRRRIQRPTPARLVSMVSGPTAPAPGESASSTRYSAARSTGSPRPRPIPAGSATCGGRAPRRKAMPRSPRSCVFHDTGLPGKRRHDEGGVKIIIAGASSVLKSCSTSTLANSRARLRSRGAVPASPAPESCRAPSASTARTA